ncbi:MAG: ATP-binding protein [Dehalococcoidia bacterium]
MAKFTASAQPSAEELVRQLSLLRSVADSVPVLVAYVDSDHRYRYANRAYQTWFGLDVATLPGQHFREVDGEDAYAIARPYMERACGGEFLTYSASMPYVHGPRRDVEVTYIPDGGAEPRSGFFAIVSDMSEQRVAERAGRDEILRLIRIVEAAPAMSYTIGPNGEVEYATSAWERFFGMKVEDSRDWRSAGLIHPDDLEAFVDSWTRSFGSGEPFEMEFRGRRHDGEYRWLLSRGVAIRDPSGAIERWVAVNVDIHDRKQLEDERERVAADLRAANASKDEFLGLVSHELKTPITTILGNAQILRTKGFRLDEESRNNALQDIESESQRLHAIIDNLLVLARLDRGQELAVEPVFVRRVLRETIDEFAHKSGRRITLDAPDGYAFVLADPVYIRQVIENLLSNADKYSPQGQPIEVVARRDGDDLRVLVIDRGHGFAPEEAKKLFQPFYRSTRTSRDVSGVGIGLAVCQRIIEALGGEMWAAMAPGGGAQIGFSLPLSDEDAGAE